MIKIQPHHHTENSGLGNNLFKSCFAQCHAIETGQQVFNWLVTDILHGADREGVLSRDNNGLKWGHLNIDINAQSKIDIVGKGTNLSSDEFHQSANDIDLIKKHKNLVVKDFGRREGTFAHFRMGTRKDYKFLIGGERVPTIEYYRQQLKKITTNNDSYISSDWPDHAWIVELCEEFGLKVYSGEPEETIIFGSQFKNKILSLGTFSWWIGFLGSQNNVLCPNPNNYPRWHGPIFDCMDDWSKV